MAAPVKEERSIEVPTSFTVPENLKMVLKARFPGYSFKPKPGATPADHPITACERAVVEEHLCYRVNGAIAIDIGGNPNRHKSAKRGNIHVCAPPTEPKDYVDIKFHRMSNLSFKEVCSHHPFDCKCVVPDVFISIYSLQGITPDEMLKYVNACTNKMVFAAFRDYNQALGTVCGGEISYIRDERGIQVSVQGDNMAYRVVDDSWVYNAQYYSDSSHAMAWKLLNTFGDTKVFCFTEADLGADTSKLVLGDITLLESLNSNARARPIRDPRGPFTKDELIMSRVTDMKINVASAVSFWNWIVYVEKDTPRKFYCPKGAICEVRLFVSGKDRTPLLFASALQKTKESIKKYGIPEDLMADAVFATAVTAFYTDVENEISMLAPKVHDFDKPVKHLAQLLKFDKGFAFLGPYATSTLVICVTLTLVLICREVYLFISKRRRHTRQFGPDGPASYGSVHWIVPLIAYILACLPRRSASRGVSAAALLPPWVPIWAIEAYKKGTHVISLIHHFAVDTTNMIFGLPVQTQRYPNICNAGRELTPIHETATIVMPIDTHCKPGFGAALFGVGCPEVMPVVSRTCVHNEEIAVRNRGLLARPPSKTDLWEVMNAHFDKLTPIIECQWVRNGRLQVIPFNDWCARFPPAQRELLRKAREDLRSTNETVSPLIKGFVKVEHVLKSHPLSESLSGSVDYYDPRLIQGRRPHYQVVTGPTTYSMTKYLAYLWHPDATYGSTQEQRGPRPLTTVVYTSGLSAEELGGSIHTQYKRLEAKGRVIVAESDQSRLDAHCGEESLDMKNRIYYRLRVKRRNLNAILQALVTLGFTRRGIKYYIEATVQSGNGDTSSGDVIICIVPADKTFEIINAGKSDYVMYGTGDDNLTLMLEQYWREYVRVSESIWKELGFKIEQLIMTSLYDAEYCSGRLYPTSDGLVYGPKIGRIMAKTFYAKVDYSDSQGARWLKAVALGLHRDTAFIPVLRVVIPKILELVENRTPIRIRDDERPHATKWHSACPETWLMMEHLYDVTTDHLLALERWLQTTITHLPILLSHPTLTAILTRDVPRLDIRRKTQVYPFATIFITKIDLPAWMQHMPELPLWVKNLVDGAIDRLPQVSMVPTMVTGLIRELGLHMWNQFKFDDIQNLSMGIAVGVIGPVTEEFAKRITGLWFTACYPFFEYIINQKLLPVDPLHPQSFTEYMLIVGWKHWMWGHLSRHSTLGCAVAMALHSSWNMYVLYKIVHKQQLRYDPVISAVLVLVWGYITWRPIIGNFKPRVLRDFILATLRVMSAPVRLFGRAWNKLMHALFGNTSTPAPRGILNEMCQILKFPMPLTHTVAYGPQHDLMHTATVTVIEKKNGETQPLLVSTGMGKTKAAAEDHAASALIPQLRLLMETRAKEEAEREENNSKTLMMGAMRTTQALAQAYYWKYIIVDADNIPVPKTRPLYFGPPILKDGSYGGFTTRTQVLLVGVPSAINGWVKSGALDGVPVRSCVVEPGRDAADNALIARLGYFDPCDTIVGTRDKKLITRIHNAGDFTVFGDLEHAQFHYWTVMHELPATIAQLLIQCSSVPDIGQGLIRRKLPDLADFWAARL